MGSVVGSNVNVSNVTTRRMDSTTFLPEATPTLSEREQLKIEFYKTYDVMTGVRIAATLGGFFGLMILLLVYKSRRVSVLLSQPFTDNNPPLFSLSRIFSLMKQLRQLVCPFARTLLYRVFASK